MLVDFDVSSMESYQQFMKLKRLPTYQWKGHQAVVPDEYASQFTGTKTAKRKLSNCKTSTFLFDYQRDIAALAMQKRKFAVFAECGLGKTLIMLEFARHAAQSGKMLIVSPIMVIKQTIDESNRFYPDMQVKQVAAADLQLWLDSPDDGSIGITNYESIREGLTKGNLCGLCLDESSYLKSHYGAWGTRLIELGKGLEWKLCLTGTPAPNDRVEYANHSIFLDNHKTINEFLARYFVNRGETQNRWELMHHAIQPFYRDLSHWCIFLSNPAVYGWKDNCNTVPPINVHIDYIDLTDDQRDASQKLTGTMFVNQIGGIGERAKLSQIAKGKNGMATNKPEFIRKMVASWPNESTIIWCRYNDEQDSMARTFPDAVNISGDTPLEKRIQGVKDFQTGVKRILISKPKILGFGLNLQIATRHVFSGLQDSYEEFHQAVKRSNRIGSTLPLNVHIPVTELEEPMIATVLSKAKRVASDTAEQEKLFKELAWTFNQNT